MDLNLEEQRLIAAYRSLNQAGRDDALSYLIALTRRSDNECGTQTCQCSLKSAAARPGTEKTPIFTE